MADTTIAEAGQLKEAEMPRAEVSQPTAASGSNSEAFAAKRQKISEDGGERKTVPLQPTPANPKAVQKQVEYYLSDENLKHDKFFHDKISWDPEGWLDLSLILSCKKMKVMRTTEQDVIQALADSTIELRQAEPRAVRRPGNSALPKLEPRCGPNQSPKKQTHAHDGGVIAVLREASEEQGWMQIKEALRKKLPEHVNLWFVSTVSDKGQCMVASAPFDGDLTFFEDLTLDVGGEVLRSEICYGELLQHSLKMLPKHIKEKREKEARKRQKDRNKPITLGTQRFMNVTALRGRVKEILNARSQGEELKVDGSDFKLIRALLEFHPKGADKSNGLVGIKVDTSSYGDSRCFFILKEGGEIEDFSAKKCLDAVEANPPYVDNASKAKAELSSDSPGKDPIQDLSSPTVSDTGAKAVATPLTSSAPEDKNA